MRRTLKTILVIAAQRKTGLIVVDTVGSIAKHEQCRYVDRVDRINRMRNVFIHYRGE